MEKKTFEQAMNRLEEIIKVLENNQTSLEDSLALFQEGMELTKLCSDKLQTMEEKVAKIMVDDTTIKDMPLEE